MTTTRTLPTTGSISLLDVIEQLDGTATPRLIGLGDADVRELAGVPSGEISLADLRGKPTNPPIQNVVRLGLRAEVHGRVTVTPLRSVDYLTYPIGDYSGPGPETFYNINFYLSSPSPLASGRSYRSAPFSTTSSSSGTAADLYDFATPGVGIGFEVANYIVDDWSTGITHQASVEVAYEGRWYSAVIRYEYDCLTVLGREVS